MTRAQADVTDNCDGTYALQFALPLAGRWQLSASVAGEDVPWPQAAALKSVHAPLTAEECEISGVDGIVSCGTSDPIFVQVSACMWACWLQLPCISHMSGSLTAASLGMTDPLHFAFPLHSCP